MGKGVGVNGVNVLEREKACTGLTQEGASKNIRKKDEWLVWTRNAVTLL